jgi:hypothetical protein
MHPSRPALGPNQPPFQSVPGLSRSKGAWRWQPTPIQRRGLFVWAALGFLFSVLHILHHLKIRVDAAVTLATRPFPNFVQPFA